jgi:glutathione S-transferase
MSCTLYVGDYQLSSWSLRPWLALTVGGVPFETVVIRLDRPGTPAALAAVSPTGRVPVLHVDGVVVWESLAICEYAAELAPDLWPEDRAKRARARSVATEMHGGLPNLRREHPMNLLARTPRAPSDAVRAELARFDAIVAACRGWSDDGAFLFGSFSVADAMYAPVATRIRTYDLPVAEATAAWCDTVLSHPAMREWERRAKGEAAGDGA